MWVPWFKKVEEVTNGKVRVVGYPGSVIAKSPDQFEACVTGLADIVEFFPSHTPGRYPLSQVIELPGLTPASTLQAHRQLWELYKTVPEIEAEYPGVKVVGVEITGINIIITKTPVRTLEDLKGLKIDILGIAPKEIAAALGFVATPMMMFDMYMSLEKGVIDGISFPYDIYPSYQVQRVTSCCTECDFGRNTAFVVMNLNKWNSLPSDIRKQMEGVLFDWFADYAGEQWTHYVEVGEKLARDSGVEIIKLAPEERARWDKALEPLRPWYVGRLEAKGLPGQKVLDEVLRLRDKYAD